MTKSATKEMFNYRNHITYALDKFSSIDDKRELISKYSGPLWYVFGYKLESKPWLTYEERYL